MVNLKLLIIMYCLGMQALDEFSRVNNIKPESITKVKGIHCVLLSLHEMMRVAVVPNST